MSDKKNIAVVVKERPLIKREKEKNAVKQWRIDGDSIESLSPLIQNRYTFDKIYKEDSTNEQLYNKEVKPIVEQVVKGYNGTVFAYGQTSSGKTFTMLGDKRNPGVIRLAARQIFSEISKAEEGCSFLIRMNYIEIYNEKVYDLLNKRAELKIKELPSGELIFGDSNQGGKPVSSEDDILKEVDTGNSHRKVAETNMNVQSSRSHAILQINIQSAVSEDDPALVSILNLVDLAGSERAEQTGATGERLKEASNINKSLLTLSIVINKLAEDPDNNRGHIGYRDSKLTRLLQNSLGGNSMTVMICAITPAALEETNNTLGFATRAKKIENKPVVNEVVSDAVEVKRMRKKITYLEDKLDQQKRQIEEVETMKTELLFLKTYVVNTTMVPVPQTQRRRTWGGDFQSMLPIKSEMSDNKVALSKTPSVTNGSSHRTEPFDMKLLSGDRGCGDSENSENFDESQWQNFTEFFKMPIINENDSTPTHKGGNKNPYRKSLLRTPKSVKNLMNRVKDDTPNTSAAASPIALDKDKRIRSLETELDELRHYQFTEMQIESTDTAELQASLDEKIEEIAKLTENVESVKQQRQDAINEQKSAVKAKEYAEQQLTSIEYEYEQHKARANRREKELVEQLTNLNNDEQIKQLKEKLQIMSERAKLLETELWQDRKKHIAEVESLNGKIVAEQEKSQNISKQINKLKTIQTDYDEVSTQLVDCIEENDKFKSQHATMNETIDTLNKKINDLEAQLANQSSADKTCNDLQAKLQTQSEDHATELQTLQDDHRKEIEHLNKDIKIVEKKYSDAFADVLDLKKWNDAAQEEIAEVKANYNDLYNEYTKLEHNHSMLQNAWKQSTLTMDCVSKELDYIRDSYVKLQHSSALQELDNLKLQKTICEYNDTINGSLFNETASMSVVNITQQNSTIETAEESMTQPKKITQENTIQNHSIDASNESMVQIEKPLQAMNDSATQWELMKSRLMSVMEDEASQSPPDFSEMIDKVIVAYNEFNNIKQLLESTDAQGVIEIIRSQIDRNATVEEEITSMGNELKTLKEKCNELQSIKQKNEDLIETLNKETQTLTNQLELLQSEEKRLKEEFENEKSCNGLIIDDLQKKVAAQAEREVLLNEQTAELSDIKSKQRVEITRLQQMISDKSDLSSELSKLNQEINELQEKLRNSLNERDSLKALLNEKEQEIISKGSDLTEKLNEIIELEQIIESNKTKIEDLNEQLNKLNQTQEANVKMLEEKSVEAQSKFKEQLTQKNAELKRSTEKIEELTKAIETYQHNETSNKENFNQIQNDLNDKLARKEEELKIAASKIAELTESLENINQFKSSNQEDFEKLQSEMQAKINQKEEELKTANAKITELNEAIEFVEQIKKTSQETFDKNQQEFEENLAKKEQELQTALSKIAELSESVEKSKQIMASNQENFDKVQNETHAKIKQTEDELKNANEKVAELSVAIEKSERIESEMREKYKQKDRDLNIAYVKINELEMKIRNNDRTKMDMEKKLKEDQQQMSKDLVRMQKELKEAVSEATELKEIVANYERMKDASKISIDELTHKIASMKEEQERLENTNRNLESKAKNQVDEISGLIKQLSEVKQTKKSIESERKKLLDELNALQSKRPSLSPKRDINDIELLRDENRKLKTQHQQLEKEVEELRTSTSHGRKKKRYSLHDDTRRISGYDSTMIDMEVQTDPVDEMCGCIQMSKDIKKLKQEKLIIETRYAVFRKSTGVDDLLAEVKTLKTELNAITHKLNRANVEISIYKQENEELKIKQAIAQEKPSTVDAQVQTECKTGASFVEQMDWQRVNNRAENYKKHYTEIFNAYNELKEKYKKLGPNNQEMAELNELKAQFEQLKIQHQEKTKAMEHLQWKYIETKRICDSRFEEINQYKEQMEMNMTKAEMRASGETAYNELKVTFEELKAKYETNVKKCHETAELLVEIKEKYRLSKQINQTSLNDIETLKQEINNFQKSDAKLKSELEAIKQQLDETEAELELVKNKYGRAKEMLAERQARVEKLRIFEQKYGHAKELLESRRLEILRLQALVNDNDENNENAPMNK